MDSAAWFAGGLGLAFLACVAPIASWRRPRLAVGLSCGLLVLFGIVAIITGTRTIATGGAITLTLPPLLPDTTLAFRVDALSGWFLDIIGLLVIAVSVYGIGYLQPHADRDAGAWIASCTAAFVLAMTVAVTAANTILFLAAWESMSLASYALVVHHHHLRGPPRAGFIYIVMAHAGTAFLLAAFLMLPAPAGDPFAFATLTAGAAIASEGKRTAIFACLLVGFGTKAGVVPLHIWLPRAHPEAPGHASALMSGVMIKVAIYGIVRFAMEILGPGPVSWGIVVLVLGALSAVIGVLSALMEHDLKRLLAYHSVENIGIILMGIGASMIFVTQSRPALAALALGAGLFHTLNHALFKGLLFLGAGALHQGTGTKNIESYGGLIHRMPWTAAFFLIGCISIAGLPPFNGFVSEWVTYQALLAGFDTRDLAVRTLMPLCAVALAFTGALAAACFVKAFGVSFLARPRSARAAAATEPASTLLFGMGALAVPCILAGICPGPIFGLLDGVTTPITGAGLREVLTEGPVPVVRGPLGTLAPGILASVVVLTWMAAAWLCRPRRVCVEPTWGCGIDLDPDMEYTATGFGQPIRQFYRKFYRPREEIHEERGDGGFSPSRITYRVQIIRFAEHLLYRPIYRQLLILGRRTASIQSGSLHLYLLYILITAMGLLLWVA